MMNTHKELPLSFPGCPPSPDTLTPLLHNLSDTTLPSRPPPLSPARASPQGIFEFDQSGGFDPTDPDPIPEFEFDQSLPD